jgi:hypothetical protein
MSVAELSPEQPEEPATIVDLEQRIAELERRTSPEVLAETVMRHQQLQGQRQ